METKYRGDILIHAGKGIDKEAIERFKYLNLQYPQGYIIAKAKIKDCVYVDNELRKKLKLKDEKVYKGIQDKTWKGYGFKIEEVQKIKPIKINGKLSLWEFNYKEK